MGPRSQEFGAAFDPIEDLMKKVLFQCVLPEYNPDLVVAFDRTGGVTMEYVDYLKCVKKHIRQYEGHFAAEIKSFTPVLIKDPYFMIGNISTTTVANLEAECYKSQLSSKRKCDDSAPLAEPAKRGKLQVPMPRVPPSSTSKANGSSTVACSPKSSQSPIKGTSSFLGKTVKHRSPRLLCKMNTIPNTPNDHVSVGDEDSHDEDSGGCSSSSTIGGISGEGVAQDVIQDNPQVVAECENNVDSGVPYEGNSVGSNVEPIQMLLVQILNPPSQRPTLLILQGIPNSAHDEFEYFHDDAKALLSCFASSNPSFVLPVDLSPLFKRLGYRAFLNSWASFIAHTCADLWDIHKDMVETHLNNLKLFKFKYDSLSFDVSALQERIDSLTTELNTVKAKLVGVSLERGQLAKTKEAASSVMTYDDLL
ncbi:hypothetical protein PIB30_042439 [Stylosanthes scabra]|uniref:Uncharacterized protein n=1 Tax=Stylosanthes scabra TaxID=79078 RepID=A0ABU6SFF2_9FABA|nr:hypothetical protein [Stylosanthes scabra]